MCKLVLLVLLTLITSQASSQVAHDVSADSILEGAGRMPVAVNSPLAARFTNRGASTETNVPIIMEVRDGAGNGPYRDTIRIAVWPSGRTIDTAFRDFIPQYNTMWKIIARSELPGDMNRANDTATAVAASEFLHDIRACAVLVPKPNEQIKQGTLFRPTGSCLNNYSIADAYDIPFRVEIRSCTTGALAFRADTVWDYLVADSIPENIVFPYAQAANDVRKLAPGCYKIAVIARYQTDGDRSNDTAYSEFSIVSGDGVRSGAEDGASLRLIANPVHGEAEIAFRNPQSEVVDISVIDLLGEEVIPLHRGVMEAGEHVLRCDVSHLASGSYQCVARHSDHIERMALVIAH